MNTHKAAVHVDSTQSTMFLDSKHTFFRTCLTLSAHVNKYATDLNKLELKPTILIQQSTRCGIKNIVQDKIGISPGAGHSIVAGEAVISVDVLKGNRVFNAFTDTFYCSQHVFVSKGYCFQWCHNSVYMLSPLII